MIDLTRRQREVLAVLQRCKDFACRVDLVLEPRARYRIRGTDEHISDATLAVLSRLGWVETRGYEQRWLLRDSGGPHVFVNSIRRVSS